MNNPYQPLDYDNSADPVQLIPASKGTRFGGYIIDVIVYYIILFLCGALFTVGVDSDGIGEGFVFLPFLLFFLYFIVMESVFGKTLGKMLTKTRVVNEYGDRPSIGAIIGRTFSRIIPFDALSLLFGERAWHDSISGTYVVNDPKPMDRF